MTDWESADPLANAPCEARLTRCRESFTEAHLERLAQAERIDALEAEVRELKRSHTTTANELAHAQEVGGRLASENAALREFVAAADEWTKWCVCCMDEYEPQFRPVMQRYDQERQRLATEFGLPLPEVER